MDHENVDEDKLFIFLLNQTKWTTVQKGKQKDSPQL